MWTWLFPAKKALLYSALIVFHDGTMKVSSRNITLDDCREISEAQHMMTEVGMWRVGNIYCIAEVLDATPDDPRR